MNKDSDTNALATNRMSSFLDIFNGGQKVKTEEKLKLEEQQQQQQQRLAQRQRHSLAVELMSEDPMVVEKQKPKPQRRRSTMGMTTVTAVPTFRDPPIPTTIHRRTIKDRENCQLESSSQNSLVSEVTMMTYSEEKATMLREEFMRRMKQFPQELTGGERQALANEVQQEIEAKLAEMGKEQESKFHEQHAFAEQRTKKKQQQQQKLQQQTTITVPTGSDGGKSDLLKRFRALKTQQMLEEKEGLRGRQETKKIPSSQQKEERSEEGIVGTTAEEPVRWNPRKERLGGFSRSFSSNGTTKVGNLERLSSSDGPGMVMRRKSYDESIDAMTADTGDSKFSLIGDYNYKIDNLERRSSMSRVAGSGGLAARPTATARTETIGKAKNPIFSSVTTKSSSDSKFHLRDDCSIEDYGNNDSDSEKTQETNSNIEQIIELKLLVANQQATIDTLSSKLHNFNLAHRQLRRIDQTRVKKLELENRQLADQLEQCREREKSLMGELKWGGYNDDPVMRENAHLRYQLALMGGSVSAGRQDEKRRRSLDTILTHVSTDADSVPHSL
mmetsp:Transcript_31028/g.67107  ORF Transcript_31028/g.67107 Transcript_31028/m.67107 type:complete len:557 (+) Transcript_31028:62-1732(+)